MVAHGLFEFEDGEPLVISVVSATDTVNWNLSILPIGTEEDVVIEGFLHLPGLRSIRNGNAVQPVSHSE